MRNVPCSWIAATPMRDDYLINVLTWLDTHPDGLQAAVSHFRHVVDTWPPA